MVGVILNDVVCPDVDAREDIAGGIHGSAATARGTVPPSHHVAQDALAGLRSIDGSRYAPRIQGSQGLDVGKNEHLVLIVRAADAPSMDVMHEVALPKSPWI